MSSNIAEFQFGSNTLVPDIECGAIANTSTVSLQSSIFNFTTNIRAFLLLHCSYHFLMFNFSLVDCELSSSSLNPPYLLRVQHHLLIFCGADEASTEPRNNNKFCGFLDRSFCEFKPLLYTLLDRWGGSILGFQCTQLHLSSMSLWCDLIPMPYSVTKLAYGYMGDNWLRNLVMVMFWPVYRPYCNK